MIGFIMPGQDMAPMVMGGLKARTPPGGRTPPQRPPDPRLPDPPADPQLPTPPRRPEDPQPIDEPEQIPPEVPSPIGDPPPDVPSLPGPGRRNPGIGAVQHGRVRRLHTGSDREHRQILCING